MSIVINGQDRPTTINDPSTIPHGTYHMADNPAMYEPQRTNNFEFMVTGLGSRILKAGFDPDDSNAYLQNPEDVIRLSVASTSIPHFTQRAIEVRRGNTLLKYAGVPEFEGGRLTINDYIGTDAKLALMAWQNQSYNVRTEKVGLAKDYKHDCYLMEYTPDFQLVRSWKLYGCWISSVSESEYSVTSNDMNQVSAEIIYDKEMLDTSDIE